VNLPIDLGPRLSKPRDNSRTQILDKGSHVDWIRGYLADYGSLIDMAKLGWGSSLVTPKLIEKIALYKEFDVDVCLGGTLFELMWVHGRIDEYEQWLRELGLTTMEISDGTVDMDEAEKVDHIVRFAESFTVLSEVGSKDADAIVSPVRWVDAIKQELAAGASYVILEGRESGTAGMYRKSGEIRMGLIDEILESGIPLDRLVFEAAKKPHQVWLIEHLGPTINIGNVPMEEALSVETLRLGLRADTLQTFHSPK